MSSTLYAFLSRFNSFLSLSSLKVVNLFRAVSSRTDYSIETLAGCSWSRMCHLNPIPWTNLWLYCAILWVSRTAWNELFSPSKALSPNLVIISHILMSSWQNISVANMLNLMMNSRIILRSESTKALGGNSILWRYDIINIMIYLQWLFLLSFNAFFKWGEITISSS